MGIPKVYAQSYYISSTIKYNVIGQAYMINKIKSETKLIRTLITKVINLANLVFYFSSLSESCWNMLK